jgi:competence ComEA-like helix-hairpin-helix protein
VGGKGEAKRGKAWLLVSMIVLVWNIGITARHLLSTGSPVLPPSSDCTAAIPQVPLTVKQNFLLGKRVDINLASLAEIEGLPGISRKVAESVIETRNRLGRFRSPQDLLKVTGIKEKRLKKILPFLVQFPNN